MDGERDDTGDLRLRRVRGMLWGKVALTVAVQAVLIWELRLPASAVVAGVLPFPALLVLLAGPRSGRRRLLLIGILLVGCLAPFAAFGWRWNLLTPLAICALCAIRGRAAWWAFGAVVGATFVVGICAGLGAGAALNVATGSANQALVIFAVDALALTVAALHATRRELIDARLARERRRIDGELRTVVGSGVRELYEQLALATGEPPEAKSRRIGAAVELARRTLTSIRSTAGGYRRPAVPPPAPIESPAIARRMLAVLYAFEVQYFLVANLDDFHRPWIAAATTLWTVAVGVLLLAGEPSHRRLATAGSVLLVPLIVLGAGSGEVGRGIVFLPFFAGVALVRLRRPHAWVVAGLASGSFVAATLVAYLWTGQVQGLAQVVGNLVFFAGHTWAAYGLLRLAELVRVQHQARADLIREAIARERTHVARDLHDLLSFSLSAVALKGELCQRLLAAKADVTDGQLAELVELALRARAELDALAAGQQIDLRLDDEVAAAAEVLRSAGITVTTAVADVGADAHFAGDLVAVLREAVTNVVKHSRARTCSIAVTRTPDAVRLRVVNDGVRAGAPKALRPAGSGSGLLGMAERSGGRLVARRLPHARFEVAAEFVACDGCDGCDGCAGSGCGAGEPAQQARTDGRVAAPDPLAAA